MLQVQLFDSNHEKITLFVKITLLNRTKIVLLNLFAYSHVKRRCHNFRN